DGVADALGDGVVLAGHIRLRVVAPQGVVVLQRDADGQDPALRGDPHHSLRHPGPVTVPGDDARHRRPVQPPVAAAGAAQAAGEVGTGDDLPGEVGVVAVDAGVEDGDGDAASPRVLP